MIVYRNDSWNPDGHGDSWAKQFTDYSGLLCLYGYGLGFHAAEFLRRAPDAKLLVLEPDKSLLRQSAQYTRSLLSNDRLAITHNLQDFSGAFGRLVDRWKPIRVCALPSYEFARQREYAEFLKWFAREMQTTMSDVCTALRFCQDWQQNYLLNLGNIASAAPLAPALGAWQNLPVVIVASGPSLDLMLDLVDELDRRAIIIAAGSSFRKLLDAGIKTDYCVSFDGGLSNYFCHFDGMKGTDTPLLCDLIVHHKIFSHYTGPRLVMNVWPGTMLDHITGMQIGNVRIGPSVANTCFDLALKLGGNPIVLLAQDLSFPDHKTHAFGTHTELTTGAVSNYDILPEHEAVDYEDYSGRILKTNHSLITFCHWFENIISQTPGRVVYNCSHPDGMDIRGTRRVRPSELLQLLPDHDVRQAKQLIRDSILKNTFSQSRNRIIEVLREFYFAGEQCRYQITQDWFSPDKHMSTEKLALYFFSFQPAWDAHKGKLPMAEIKTLVREALDFTQPLITQAIDRLSTQPPEKR